MDENYELEKTVNHCFNEGFEAGKTREQKRSISELLDEVASAVCDGLCKWPDQYRTPEGKNCIQGITDQKAEQLNSDHCKDCPVNRLFQ